MPLSPFHAVSAAPVPLQHPASYPTRLRESITRPPATPQRQSHASPSAPHPLTRNQLRTRLPIRTRLRARTTNHARMGIPRPAQKRTHVRRLCDTRMWFASHKSGCETSLSVAQAQAESQNSDIPLLGDLTDFVTARSVSTSSPGEVGGGETPRRECVMASPHMASRICEWVGVVGSVDSRIRYVT